MANIEKIVQLNVYVEDDSETDQVQWSETDTAGASASRASLNQLIATTWTSVSLAEVSPADLLVFRNKDTVNYIQLATSNSDAAIFARLTASRCCYVFGDPTQPAYFARANTTPSFLCIKAVEA